MGRKVGLTPHLEKNYDKMTLDAPGERRKKFMYNDDLMDFYEKAARRKAVASPAPNHPLNYHQADYFNQFQQK